MTSVRQNGGRGGRLVTLHVNRFENILIFVCDNGALLAWCVTHCIP